MKVIVCGGRTFGAISYQDADGHAMPFEVVNARKKEREFQFEALHILHKQHGFTFIAEGGAKGADTTAFWFRKRLGIDGKTWEAKWDLQGKSAGSVRNQLMLFESGAEMVIAFPGGPGTADMVRKAKARNVPVIEVVYVPTNKA